jgi:hypothetical protein
VITNYFDKNGREHKKYSPACHGNEEAAMTNIPDHYLI